MKALLLALFAAPCLQAATVQVYLAAGQSNATTTWSNAIDSTLQGIAGDEEVMVVHSIHSGAAMWQWFNQGSPGQNYSDDLAAVRAVIDNITAAGDTPEFRGIFWMQGESDSLSPASINAYKDRFEGMIAQYQSDLGLATLPGYAVGITDANPAAIYDDPLVLGTTRENVYALRAVQFGLGGAVADSRGLARVDQWHLTESAQAALGQQMAQAFTATYPVPEPSSVGLALASATGLLRRRRP